MRKFTPGFADPRGTIMNGFDGEGCGLVSQLTAVPADTTPGYATGGLMFVRDGVGVATLYRNEGTVASCAFKRLLSVTDTGGVDLTGLTATATELNQAADVTGQVVALTTTPIAITEAAHNNRTMYITKTDGIAITLPVPVAGMRFKFVIGATIASASTIKSVAGTHVMIGHALMGNDSDNTTVLWQALAASTYDTIDLLGTGNSTGGIEGQVITISAMSATRWFVEIIGDAAGTEATPFADTVT